MPKKITHHVPPGEKEKRLDIYLHLAGIFPSRMQAKRVIDEGGVQLNGKGTKPRVKIRTGDLIEVILPEPKSPLPLPEDIPLEILYEDNSIVVVDKPAGMTVHPAAGNRSGTLVNALLHHCRDLSGIGGVLRPGIVHRLDKDTSGVIVSTKNDVAHISIAAQFKAKKVKKRYLALILGRFPSTDGTISSTIARHPTMRVKMKSQERKGREAITRWRLIKAYPGASLLEVIPETGRTHQIRVHLSEAGHPVAGDKVYGTTRRVKGIQNQKVREALLGMKRQALHASFIGFHHPVGEVYLEFKSPLPPDMKTVIEALENAD